jgi:WD40 repeat protein
MTSIFLSYARDDDEAFVRRLHRDLVAAGFRVWFDRESMPSRSLTFQHEVREAVAACDRLLLVVGPQVLASDYVAQEWQFAYFAANKCVNPIVRLDGSDAAGQRVDGYRLLPEDLRLLHAEDFRDDAYYAEHLAQLVRQLSEPLPPVGKLVAVPELPPGYRAQPERLRALRDMLLIDLRAPVVVSDAAARLGLQGMAGIGKSVLANALAHRPEVQRAFRDNIFWLKLGQQPQIEDLQRWLARQLGDPGRFADRYTGKEALRRLLADRAVLLILDDVWNREDAEAFNIAGPRGRLLLTTRDAGLVTALAARENHYRVELPSAAEAEALLGAAADVAPAALPPAAHQIIARTGRLPLALALCGGIVRAGTPWHHVLEALQEHDLEFLSADHPAEEQHRNAWVAMDISLRALPEAQRERFAELSVFALGSGVPEAAVATLWQHTGGLSARQTARLLGDFTQRTLVQRTAAIAAEADVAGAITLHDLLHNFAEGMALKRHGTLAALHRLLLDAYRVRCPNGWTSGPDDGYFLQKLCSHLLAAGQIDEAVELLDGLAWVATKCKVGLVFEVLADYRQTIETLPEAQQELEEERRQRARLTRWGEELTEYARQWSRRRDIEAQTGQPVTDPEPKLPEPPATCRMWTEEEIAAECTRLLEHPTRLDRLRAFEGFVWAQCYPLLEHGQREGFVGQHALAQFPSGPVYAAAQALLANCLAPVLLRRWPPGSVTNPKPALLATLHGHGEGVWCVGLTADGRRAVSGSFDNTLRVWDLDTGQCLRTLHGHGTGRFVCVTITADGRRAVSGSSDYTLRVWDLGTGQCLRTLHGHDGKVESVAVTADGRRAVSGSLYSALRVWDLDTGQCLRRLHGHDGEVESVAITPDGRRAVSGSDDKTLRVWDLDTGQCLHTLHGHDGAVTSVAVTPDGRRAVSGSTWYNTLRVWDLDSGQCLRTLHGQGKGVACFAVTPDGRRAMSVSLDNTLRVWDLDTGQCLRTLHGHDWFGGWVALTLDGRRAVSGSSWYNTLRVWNLDTGQFLRTLQGHGEDVKCVAVSPDGRGAVSGSSDYTLRVWNLDTGQCLRTLHGHSKGVECVGLTADGRRAVSGSSDNTLRVWDLDTGQCLHTLHGHDGEVESVAVTPDGRRAVSGSWDNTLRVWDLDTGQCLHTLQGHDGAVTSVAVTPDGRRAVSGSSDNTLRVRDLDTGQCLHTLQGHDSKIESVAVTPDGRRAVSGSSDNTLRVWDLDTGQCLHTLQGHDSKIESVAVTPDGRRAVSGSWDNTLRVWDLDTGQCLHTLQGHDGEVESVAVTPDGRGAVSRSWDNTLRVWDLVSGHCLAVHFSDSVVYATAVARRGNRILAATAFGDVMIVHAENIPAGPSIVTAPRCRATRCPDCGGEFEPDPAIRSAIQSVTASLTPDQSPCLDLPDAAFADPRLLSQCPRCNSPVKFNPFFAGADRGCPTRISELPEARGELHQDGGGTAERRRSGRRTGDRTRFGRPSGGGTSL